MRILFLNQYFPPDSAPTGVLLREVADALAAAGHEVVFASSRQDYRAGQKRGSRMRRELQGLWKIFWDAWGEGGVDAVISATSPPMLVVIGAIIAKMRGARHYHWLFDMYPELATALGEVRQGAAARFFSMATRWAYRGADCVVALDEDMARRLKDYGVSARIIPPWVASAVISARANQAMAPNAARGPERMWLYSGNLGRAHEWRTLIDAQKLLETAGSPWRLVFQGGGPSWPVAREYAREAGLTRCDWRPYVPEEDLPASLLAADVLAVTQKPEARGLLWPSKLALVGSLPRPILWVGPPDGAIARDLARLPQTGIFSPGDASGVARWLEAAGSRPEITLQDPVAIRSASLGQWVLILRDVSG